MDDVPLGQEGVASKQSGDREEIKKRGDAGARIFRPIQTNADGLLERQAFADSPKSTGSGALFDENRSERHSVVAG